MNDYYEDIPQLPTPMPGPKSDENYTQMLLQKKIENIFSQLDPEHLITDIEYRIKGYKKNVYSNSWELPAGVKEKPVAEELLVDMVSILSAALTNNVTMSNFQNVEINKIMAFLIEKTVDMMRAKAEDYGLKRDYAERNRILWIVWMSVFSSMKRAQNGLEAKRLLDALDVKEQYNAGKRGISEKLQFWK